MDLALDLIALVAVVTGVGGLCRRWDLPAPLLLVVVGIGASYLPRYEGFELDPEIVLIGFLPPLLYAAAIRTSLFDLRNNVRPIGALSVGLVIATTATVGLVAWWLLPIPLAAGLALGAVVAPPDAVAASAIARRVGMPRRAVTILEGESLINDATALVCLRSAIAAITGSVTAFEVTRDFAVSAGGGVAAGLVTGVVIGKIRKAVDDSMTDTAISFITPFIAYFMAEEVHASGVLAVVVTGVLLGHKSSVLQSASSRLFERTNWATIQFLLEHIVFLLIGLQVRSILDGVDATDLGLARIAVASLAVLATVMLVRPVFVYLMTYFPPGHAMRNTDGGPVHWQYPAVISWAGLRGVVTLAAALVLPAETPYREVLVLIAFVVTVGTLMVQGSTLPWLVRRLRVVVPDRDEDVLQAATVYQRAASAGRAHLDELDTTGVAPEVLARLRERSIERANSVWERLGGLDEAPSQSYARLRFAMLTAEREEVLRIRSDGSVPHEVLQEVLTALDVEESMLERAGATSTADRDVELQPAEARRGACEHLREHTAIPTPLTPDGCAECLASGDQWVHLRLCLACGHVGCCDSSINRHASRHYAETDHPVIRSFEVGEAWRWCFPDELTG